MILHRNADITLMLACHMARSIRDAIDNEPFEFDGPDQIHVGGREGNRREWKYQNAGRGPVRKAVVVCVRDCETTYLTIMPLENTGAATSQGCTHGRTKPETLVLTVEAPAYDGMHRQHGRVKHIAYEFANGVIHTNGCALH